MAKQAKEDFVRSHLAQKFPGLRRSRATKAMLLSLSPARVSIGTFEIGDAQPTNTEPGTEVTIEEIDKNFPSLQGATALQEITQYFALYLREYPEVTIHYDGEKIEPSTVEQFVENYPFDAFASQDGTNIEAELTIIEWKIVTERALYLCDASGFTLAEMPPGIQAPGFNFTAYLKSDFLRQLDDQDAIVLEDLHPDLHKLLEGSKEKLRDHFRRRTAEQAVDIVEAWKKEDLYPYKGEPRGVIEESERQVFDVLALNLNSYLPDFDRADAKHKRLALQLLKQALEKDATALQLILEDVLKLPREKTEELAGLLKRTTLTAIITASKKVANRLDFLTGLEVLVFEAESKKRLLERKQLHRILATETWIFGEEFNLSVDDQSLNEVLRKHLSLLGRTPPDDAPVQLEDGGAGIVDLMLSRRIPQPRAEEREHLVVELKRPSQRIDSEVAGQIKDYAFAIAEDERFKDTNTRWVFWAVSNEMTDAVRRDAKQRNRPEGLLFEDDENRITVWVRTWAQILESSRGRLEFFQKQLEYAADKDSGLEYVRQTHEKYLPKHIKKS